MGMPLALVLLPALAAAGLALFPARAAVGNAVAAGLLLLLASGLVLGGAGPEAGALRLDALNAPLVLVAAVVGFSAALFSLGDVRHETWGTGTARLYHAGFQGFLAANMLALLSDHLGLQWVAIETATLLCVVMVGLRGTPAAIEAAWRFLVPCGIGIALALMGVVLLALAAPAALEGGARLSSAALRGAAAAADARLLDLAFVFLLLGYGTKAGLAPLHSWMPDAHAEGPAAIAAMLSGLLLNAAMLGILRGTAVLHGNPESLDPGGVLVGAGLLSLFLAAFSLWRRCNARRFLGWSSTGHMGLAAVGFGLGGPAGNMAGLLHLCGHALVKSAAFFAAGAAARLRGTEAMDGIGGLARSHPALGWGLALALAALAGLPPFALFFSEALLAAASGRGAVPILPILLGGMLLAGMAVLAAAARPCSGPGPAAPGPAAGAPGPAAGALVLIPVWVHLALAAALGLALPAPLAALLDAAARSIGP